MINILIAHPKSSFVEATTQMLLAQNANYKIVGAQSLSEIIEKISLESCDLCLIDADFSTSNSIALLKMLEAIVDESFTAVLVREEQDLIEPLKKIGVHQIIVKTSGYMLKILRTAEQKFADLSSSSMNQAVIVQESRASTSVAGSPPHRSSAITPLNMNADEQGFFVCDRRGRFLSVDPMLENLTRYSRQELLQLSILDLIAEAEESGNFMRKLFEISVNGGSHSFFSQIQDKFGERRPCTFFTRALRNESSLRDIIGFQVTVKPVPQATQQLQRYHIDQSKLIAEFVNLVHLGYSEPLNIFLRRIIEVICQIFKFKRSTLALLDFRRNVFVKQAVIGYTENEGQSIEQRTLEVPYEVIDRIFEDRYRIKVIYYHQDQRDVAVEETPSVPERRTQRRRPLDKWHKRDLILLNLKDMNDRSYGYISLDDPLDGIIPTRSTFRDLELASRFVSMSIENYYRFNAVAKKNRRLMQILSNSNIFKLHLSLTELLNEVVWSAKYTLEFNLVTLVLISKKTQLLETKAVACENKIKQTQLLEITFDIHEFSDLLKEEYLVGESYLLNRELFVLEHFKQIYYGAEKNLDLEENGWPQHALLLVPIRGRDEKIIGFFMADDPQDRRFPTPETVRTLEILANQIAVAIDNRIMYVQAKEPSAHGGNGRMTPVSPLDSEDDYSDDFARGGFKKIVERFLR